MTDYFLTVTSLQKYSHFALTKVLNRTSRDHSITLTTLKLKRSEIISLFKKNCTYGIHVLSSTFDIRGLKPLKCFLCSFFFGLVKRDFSCLLVLFLYTCWYFGCKFQYLSLPIRTVCNSKYVPYLFVYNNHAGFLHVASGLLSYESNLPKVTNCKFAVHKQMWQDCVYLFVFHCIYFCGTYLISSCNCREYLDFSMW